MLYIHLNAKEIVELGLPKVFRVSGNAFSVKRIFEQWSRSI